MTYHNYSIIHEHQHNWHYHYRDDRQITYYHHYDVYRTPINYQLQVQMLDSSPIVLDLNGDKMIDVAENNWLPHAPKFYTKYARMFDINGDGIDDFTEWMAQDPGDGLLCMPENGQVRNALQLFGTAGGFRNGYEKMSLLCDKDHNGWLEGNELKGLMVWVDSNSDAKCQPNELYTLDELNVKKISTHFKRQTSVYETTDGKIMKTWDWWPCMFEVQKFRRS